MNNSKIKAFSKGQCSVVKRLNEAKIPPCPI